jgi:hypothetical protein
MLQFYRKSVSGWLLETKAPLPAVTIRISLENFANIFLSQPVFTGVKPGSKKYPPV